MQRIKSGWRGWGQALGVALAGILIGVVTTGTVRGDADTGGRRQQEEFTVQVTRIENPESRFLRTNISVQVEDVQNPDMYFYKVRDNKNGRILYYVYYKGSMLAPLYTTGD